MKSNKYLNVLYILAIIIAICSSCKKDDNTPIGTGTGSFTFRGESYSTPNFDAIIYDEYHDDDYTGYYLTFYSPEMELSQYDHWYYGNGNFITIDIICPSIEVLIPGTYIWDYENTYSYPGPPSPNIFYWGLAYIHSNNTEIEFTDGSIQIDKDGSNFDISYWATTTEGDTIRGTYTGGYNHFNGNFWK